MPCGRLRASSVPEVRHWTGFSRDRERSGDDGNSTTGLPDELTSKNAQPDSYAGRKSEHQSVHSQLAPSALTTTLPWPSTVLTGTQRHHGRFLMGRGVAKPECEVS